MQNPIHYKSHPWHGISFGEKFPDVLTAFIEIVPADTVKYEIDKASGWLKVDRPQLFSNVVPALYGFIPQTLCAMEVGKFCMTKTGKQNIIGDQDPMDILVLEEKEAPKPKEKKPELPKGEGALPEEGAPAGM